MVKLEPQFGGSPCPETIQRRKCKIRKCRTRTKEEKTGGGRKRRRHGKAGGDVAAEEHQGGWGLLWWWCEGALGGADLRTCRLQAAAVDQLDQLLQSVWRRNPGTLHEGQETSQGRSQEHLQGPKGEPRLPHPALLEAWGGGRVTGLGRLQVTKDDGRTRCPYVSTISDTTTKPSYVTSLACSKHQSPAIR